MELQNRADSLFYSYESALRDSAGSLSVELKAQAEAEAKALRQAVADKNIRPADLVQKLEALQQTIFNIGAGLYRHADGEDSNSPMSGEPARPATVESDGGAVDTVRQTQRHLCQHPLWLPSLVAPPMMSLILTARSRLITKPLNKGR